MIGKLTGRVDHRTADHVLLDVGGVGYAVHCSERTLASLPGPGGTAALYTDLLVREDVLQLFGFTSRHEREWHRLLVTVQGIGAKASMAILGTLGADGLARAIAIGDWAAIKAAPGVGPKIAQRAVNELRNKVPAVMALGDAPTTAPAGETAPAAPSGDGGVSPAVQADALSALGNLGYAPSEAARAVAEAAAAAAPGDDAATLIRAALKLLAPKG